MNNVEMPEAHYNDPKQAHEGIAAEPSDSSSSRSQAADRVPFILRAWWLREFKEYADLSWHKEQGVTGPLWSIYSDPLCDMGSLDYSYEM